MLVCCRSQSRSIICLFHFFLSKSGLDVFYHWYFSGNSSVYVNIEISSYFGQFVGIFTNTLLNFSHNTSFTFWSSINTQKIFPMLLFCDFQKHWKIFRRAKRHEKIGQLTLGAGEKHFLIREFIFICPSWSFHHFSLKHWKSVEFNSPKLGS